MTYKPYIREIVSTLNSTSTPLASGATFTGTGEKVDLPQVGIMLKTDNSGTLYFDFSNDGTNWDSTFPVHGFQVEANIPEFHTAVKLGRYFRVRFVNDAGAQSFLRLTTYFGADFIPSVAPLNQTLQTDADASLVRPTIAVDEVVLGRRGGVRHFTKFGYRDNLTAAAGFQTVWDYTSEFVPMTSADTFTVTYDNTTDGLGTTGALTIFVDYIDANGFHAQATHTLGNTGSDVTSFSGLGINRAAVSSSGSANRNTNNIVFSDTSGVFSAQAIVHAGDSTTQQAIFHTDAESDAVSKFLYVKGDKLSGGGTPRIIVEGRVFSRAIQTEFTIFRSVLDTSGGTTPIIINEPVGFKLSPTDVLYFVADTDTNNSNVDIRFSLVEYKRV